MRKPYLPVISRLIPWMGMLLAFLVVAPCGHLQAQAPADGPDPLKKPAVWEELSGHPEDSMMWARYLAKPWACMNKKERDDIARWQQQLAKALGEIVIEGISDRVDWEEPITASEETDNAMRREQERAAAELSAYITRLEETMVGESQLISDLKNNLAMNFFIIEELYAEEFRELGVEYKAYLKEHPKGRYSKAMWIEEKEKELRKLKEKHFEHLKRELLKNARKHGYGGASTALE